MTARGYIELRALGKAYLESSGKRMILDQVDHTIQPGELVVLLGRSGSGKSTLLNLLAGIDRPSSGEILIDGVCLTRLSERDRTLFRRRHIGFVFQAFNLIPTLTVEENLRLPGELNRIDAEVTAARIRRLLAQLELTGLEHRFPDRLSGGEQQRVAIARALVHDPGLILADEPTGNLDLETGRSVLALLDRLVRAAGKTLVMATHSPEVVGLADRILRIQDGRLRELGSTP